MNKVQSNSNTKQVTSPFRQFYSCRITSNNHSGLQNFRFVPVKTMCTNVSNQEVARKAKYSENKKTLVLNVCALGLLPSYVNLSQDVNSVNGHHILLDILLDDSDSVPLAAAHWSHLVSFFQLYLSPSIVSQTQVLIGSK